MIIKAVGYKNLKGRTGDVELDKATLIVGRNFTGKTTIPDAVKLALLGYHPSLDRTAKGIFALSSGDEMQVVVTTDEGASVGRVWTRARAGAISRKDYLPMGWPETPAVLLDAGAYFGASDRGRADLLFKAARVKFDLRAIKERLAEIGVEVRLQETEPQEWLEAAIEAAERGRSEATASSKRYLGTMQGLAALSANSAVPLDEDALSKLRVKRSELAAAEGKIADAKRLKELHQDTATPDENILSGLRSEAAGLDREIAAKESEAAKAEKFWEGLLKNDDCPMCGSEGEGWRKAAAKKKAAGDKLLAKELADLKAKKAAVVGSGKSLAAKIEGARTRLLAKDDEKLMDCEEVAAGIREEMATLEKALETYAADQAERARLAEAKAAHEREEALAKKHAAAKAYLLEQKAKLSEDLFGPILEKAHAFTSGITLGPLLFEGGVLGMGRIVGKERVFVPHSTMSGTEQAIVFAAFQGALAATAPIKLVVMDELGRIDASNKIQLLRNVHLAIEKGHIDQFIGIDTELPMVPDGKGGVQPIDGFAVVVRT